MRTWLLLLVVVAILGYLSATYYLAQKNQRKRRVLPPPRSKGTARSYQETNSVARLFLETVSLKEGEANWPRVLKGLNAEDEPRIRTLLLELRLLNPSDPRGALEAIEAVCIGSRDESDQLTRAELLERAHSRMKEAGS
jgi:hypothetical protein